MIAALPRPLAIAGTIGLAVATLALIVQRSSPAPAVRTVGRVPAPAIPPATPPAPAPMRVAAAPSMFGPCTELDLDGDGLTDTLEAVPDSCGTGGCVFRVSFTRPSGDQLAGEIAGHCPFEIARRPHGPADVIATWRLGATEQAVTRYRFRGHRYRELR